MVALNTGFLFCVGIKPDDVDADVVIFCFLVAHRCAVVSITDRRAAVSLTDACFNPFIECQCWSPVSSCVMCLAIHRATGEATPLPHCL